MPTKIPTEIVEKRIQMLEHEIVAYEQFERMKQPNANDEIPKPSSKKSKKEPENSEEPKVPKKRGPKKKPITPARIAKFKLRRIKANARERSRMHGLNDNLEILRDTIPCFNMAQKLSKIETLRMARNYIGLLGEILDSNIVPDNELIAEKLCVGMSQNTINLIATSLEVNPRNIVCTELNDDYSDFCSPPMRLPLKQEIQSPNSPLPTTPNANPKKQLQNSLPSSNSNFNQQNDAFYNRNLQISNFNSQFNAPKSVNPAPYVDNRYNSFENVAYQPTAFLATKPHQNWNWNPVDTSFDYQNVASCKSNGSYTDSQFSDEMLEYEDSASPIDLVNYNYNQAHFDSKPLKQNEAYRSLNCAQAHQQIASSTPTHPISPYPFQFAANLNPQFQAAHSNQYHYQQHHFNHF